MTPHRQPTLSNLRIRLRAVAVGLIVGGAAISFSAGTPAEAKDRPYLALGDSVVFGFITQAGFEYVNPDNFVGYPSYADAALRLDAANAACPGEATSGFISSSGADNGCRTFRASFPLHVAYTSTQLDFATRFLQANPSTRLVTIGLGANDLFLLQKACLGDPVCIGTGLPQVLATISSNMDTILSSLRATGFHGVLMVVNYYSLDYTDPGGTAITVLLNQAITAPAAVHGAAVADVFTAFQAAASTSFAGGKPCRAGLLNASPQNQFTCDVHPSQSGQQLLAATVEGAYRAALAGPGDD
jgi:lysophospholipase L1-like esterase